MSATTQCPRCGRTITGSADSPATLCPQCARSDQRADPTAEASGAPDREPTGAGPTASPRAVAPKAAPPRPKPAAAPAGSPRTPSAAPPPPAPATAAPAPLISVDPSPRSAASRRRPAAGAASPMSARVAGLAIWQWLAAMFLTGCALSALVVYLIWPRPPQRLIVGVDQRATANTNSAATGDAPAAKPSIPGPRAGGKATSDQPTTAPDGFPRAAKARNVNEVMRAIVKIEVPSAPGREGGKGTGFFINDKAWIATCWHVVNDATSATQARLADGSVLPLSGIIAKAPEYDLAILKPAQWPAQLTYLDISFDQEPPLGGEVFAFGHPRNEDFVVRKGAIGSLLTTNQLLDEAEKNHVLGAKVPYARSMQWIRHDTAILKGNSGGPLFLSDGRVLGVNSFIGRWTGSGYASHVRHLRDLAAKARDQVEPFGSGEGGRVFDREPPFSPGEIDISPKRIEELAESVVAGRVEPTEAEQYAPWSDLARQMTFAHYSRLDAAPEAADVVAARAKAADQAFDRLVRREYRPAQVNALGARAAENLSRPKSGVVFFGIVLADMPGLIVFRVEGTERVVAVPNEGSPSEDAPGGRRLVVGVVAPRTLTVSGPQGPMQLPMVLSHHFGPLP